jgi:hypothetical protein
MDGVLPAQARIYYINQFNAQGRFIGWQPVTGWPVTLPGWEEFAFFARRTYRQPRFEGDAPETWTINEVTTGAFVGQGAPTLKAAIEQVIEQLNAKSGGADGLRAVIAEKIAATGSAPIQEGQSV